MLSRVRLRHLFQPTPHALGVAQFILGWFRRPLRAPLLNGYMPRRPAGLSDEAKCGEADEITRERTLQLFNASTNPMPNYETFEHDVLVIGAGGAGLRAAIEASAAGVRVGLVCKSLLGKAHTVMAE